MDFLLALKMNSTELSFTNIYKVLIVFSLLGNREYVEMLLLQLLLVEYHKSIQHPHVDVFFDLLPLLVGEDIELGNRALSHASIRTSRRSELDQLDRCYKLLRCLRMAGVQFGEDMMEYRDIMKRSRRYDLETANALPVVRDFLNGLLGSISNKTFKHYQIPFKSQKTSQRIRPAESKEERKETRILILQSKTIESLTGN